MVISKGRAVKRWAHCLMLKYSIHFVKIFGHDYQNLTIFHYTNYILDLKPTNCKGSYANNSIMIF